MKKNELFAMFKYPAMIKMTAFCAATFALLSVFLKNSIVIVPHVTEVRICNILPCAYGILFGPAGAWGCAIGNLIGDFDGSFSVLSPFGFFANFLAAWVSYKVWSISGAYLKESHPGKSSVKSKSWLFRYLVCAFVSAVATAAFLAFPFDFFGSLPAMNTFIIIFTNNFAASLLGIVLFMVLSSIPAVLKMFWRVQMKEEYEYLFPETCIKFVRVNAFLSISLFVFVIIYSFVNGISFAASDSYFNILPIAVFVLYSVVQIVILMISDWEKAGADMLPGISLD